MTTLLRAALVIGAIAWFSPTHEQGGAERAAAALAEAQASRQALTPERIGSELLKSGLPRLQASGSETAGAQLSAAALQAIHGRPTAGR